MTTVGTVEYVAKIDTTQMKADATAVEDIAKKTGTTIETELESGNKKASSALRILKDNAAGVFGVAAGAAVGVYKLLGAMGDAVDQSFKLQSSLAGLSSVSKAFHQDINLTNQAAQDLASDGLMTVTDSALGLKNLMSSGFSLPESIKLMKSLKDQAVYNRQSFYSLGEAVTTTTEGIKNGNSVLADATGTTKNLSIMAKEAGIGVDEMGSISQNAGYRMAVFNGFMDDAARSSGDAAKYIDTAAGKTAQMSAQSVILEQKIGTALQPALLKLLETVTPIVTNVADWVAKNPELTSTILIATTAVLGLVAIAGTLGLAIIGLSPIFKAFGAAGSLVISGISTEFTGLSALIASPIIMPAIAVGAALIAITSVWDAYNKMQSAVEGAKKASEDMYATKKSAADSMFALLNNSVSSPETKARARQGLKNLGYDGFSSGGYTGAGATNEVAGLVHKGEYVLPKSMVNQQTGLPKSTGNTVINLTLSGIISSSPSDERAIANRMLGHINDTLKSKGMSQLGGA